MLPSYVIFCPIWYYLYNLKNVKNTMNESYFYLLRLLRRCSSRFINCKNGTKSRKASYIEISQLICSANLLTDFYIKGILVVIGLSWAIKDTEIKDLVMNIPGDNYMFKVNDKNTRTRCEICSRLTIKIYIVKFENIWKTPKVFW